MSLSIETQQRLFDVLKRIAKDYDAPSRLHKTAEDRYGISGEEAIEMAYENVKADAARAIKGLRRPA